MAVLSRGKTESGNLIGNFTDTILQISSLFVKRKATEMKEIANDSSFGVLRWCLCGIYGKNCHKQGIRRVLLL